MDKNDNKSPSKEEILDQIGIDINDEKIVFDFAKTKAFFENIHNQIQKTSENIEHGIKEGKLDLESSIGFKLEDEKIEFDLGKTKSFLEEIGEKIEHFLGSLEKTFDDKNSKS
mgnify:CR=1 FL=1